MAKKVEDYLVERLTADFVSANRHKRRIAKVSLDQALIEIAAILGRYNYDNRAYVVERLAVMQAESKSKEVVS